MLRQNGFTLIELIAVIILLAILSVSAAGKFSRNQDQQLVLLRNQLLSSLHYAQQLSLSRQNLTAASPVRVILTPAANQWTAQVIQGGTTVSSYQIDIDSAVLRSSTTDFVAACSAIPQVASQSINFDGDGNLLTGTRMRLCLVGDDTEQVCISQGGYAYVGAVCL